MVIKGVICIYTHTRIYNQVPLTTLLLVTMFITHKNCIHDNLHPTRKIYLQTLLHTISHTPGRQFSFRCTSWYSHFFYNTLALDCIWQNNYKMNSLWINNNNTSAIQQQKMHTHTTTEFKHAHTPTTATMCVRFRYNSIFASEKEQQQKNFQEGNRFCEIHHHLPYSCPKDNTLILMIWIISTFWWTTNEANDNQITTTLPGEKS